MGRKAKVQINVGDQYGQWTIIAQLENVKGRRYVLAQCSCGNECSLKFDNLLHRLSTRCVKCRTKKLKDMWKLIKDGKDNE